MKYVHKFTVKGTGHFPADMLRYDQCWPRLPEDVTAMSHHVPSPAREVTLRSSNPPTEGRWASFGWPVIQQEKYRI